MQHLQRLALVAFALLARPAVAPAGPITFDYTTTSSTSPWNGSYNPGDLTFALAPDGTGPIPAIGPGAIQLGSVQFGPPGLPDPPQTISGGHTFSVSVTVTDHLSGQTGTLALTGGALDEWFLREWDGRFTNDFHRIMFDGLPLDNEVASTRLMIGHSEYALSAHMASDDQSATFELSAVASPEPGTLVLAVFGLAPLLGVRRLRGR